jgi:hypothetical protein
MAAAVAETLERLGLGAGVRQREIWRVWDAVVGPQVARHAQPHAVSRGRLIVHVTDPIWLHQLGMMRHRIVGALNALLGESAVREIVLRIGEVPQLSTAESEERSPEPPVDPSRRAAIRGLAQSLGDAPFREALERLMLRASGSGSSGGKK